MEYYLGDTSANRRNTKKTCFVPECHFKNTPNHLPHVSTHTCHTCRLARLSFNLLLCVGHSVNDAHSERSATSLTLTPSCYLAGIPLGCHGVPMATYIYTTWLQKSARPQFSSSCGFWMQAHKGLVTQRKRKRSRNEQGKTEIEYERTFCFRSECLRHMIPVKAFVCSC